MGDLADPTVCQREAAKFRDLHDLYVDSYGDKALFVGIFDSNIMLFRK